MRLQTQQSLPPELDRLVVQLNRLLILTAQQVNALTEGYVSAAHSATTAAPTAGTHAQGDVVRNSTPTEQGVAAAKYVVTGWICTAGGTPGTWLPMRALTGN